MTWRRRRGLRRRDAGPVGVDFGSVGTWIGVAGTATTLAGVYLELEHYDRARVHGSRIPRHDVAVLLRG